MRRSERPDLGTKMYSVHEHRYYQRGKKAAPYFEYVVLEGEVVGFFTGSYTEVCLKGPDGDGYTFPYRYKLSDIGVKVFFTAKEAAELAKKMTEKHEQTWNWMLEEPIRRTWEVML